MRKFDNTGYSHTSQKLTEVMEEMLKKAPRPPAYQKLLDELYRNSDAGSAPDRDTD
jgi:hypothetical protein